MKIAASDAPTPTALLTIEGIHAALLTTAGISDKAAAHLQIEDKIEAIRGLIQNFLEPAGASFVEELVFRFLLTRGDTLGGSMRNVGGFLAQVKLTRALLATLLIAGRPHYWLHGATNQWLPAADDEAGIEFQLRGLSWQRGTESRTLIYNLTVPLVKNNVDLCLFKSSPERLVAKKTAKEVFSTPAAYLALGELKGGIDPAGADEHWKTARTALQRIQNAFAKVNLQPHIFFVGAAIEKKRAGEIWAMLEANTLGNAANLTDENQLGEISRWLCSL